MFSLEFSVEGHGWLKTSIEVGTHRREFLASDVGPDFCARLAFLALRLLQEKAPFEVPAHAYLYGEPEGLTLSFTSKNDGVELELFYTLDMDRLQVGEFGDSVAFVEMSSRDVSVTIYKALRQLLFNSGFQALNEKWHEFPIGAFLSLYRELGAAPLIEGTGIRSELEALLQMGES